MVSSEPGTPATDPAAARAGGSVDDATVLLLHRSDPDARSLRLSFVTASVEQINTGVAALAAAIREQQKG